MRKDIKAFLCLTALVGAMASVSATDFIIGDGEEKTFSTVEFGTEENLVTGAEAGDTITNYGILNNSVESTISSLINNLTVNNSGTINTGNLTNTSSITDTNGILNITGGGSNSDTITQKEVNTSGNTAFENTKQINAKVSNSGTFNNSGTSADIVGDVSNTGTLNNSGTISGAVSNNEKGFVENTGKILGKTTNISSGEIENTGTVGEVDNSGTYTNKDKGEITGDVTNSGIFTNSGEIGKNAPVNVTNKGSFVNDGSVIANELKNVVSATDSTTIPSITNNTSIVAQTIENAGTISGANGTLEINNGGSNSGSITQSALTIGGTLTNDAGSISATTINNNGTIELKNGSSLTTSNNLAGNVTAYAKAADTETTKGADNSFDIGVNSEFTGKLTVKNGGSLSINSGKIVSDAIVNLENNSTTGINGTSVNVTLTGTGDKKDTWAGAINLSNGTLTTNGVTSNGILKATGGNLNIENNSSLNIGNGSEIAAGANTKIDGTSVLNINGGRVTLDSNANDKWDGKIILGNGKSNDTSYLNVSGLDKTGTLLGDSGTLILGSKDLDIQGESYIAREVAMQLSGNINVSNGTTEKGGSVAIDDNDQITGSSPTVTLDKGGTLNYYKTSDSDLKIVANEGTLNLWENSNLTFKEGSIDDKVALHIKNGANLKLLNSAKTTILNLGKEDEWAGNIINGDETSGGIINANNLTKSSDTATLTQSKGKLNLYNNTNLILGNESAIKGGEINITKDLAATDGEVTADITGQGGSVLTVYGKNGHQVISGGDMKIDQYSKFAVGSGTFNLDSLTAFGDGALQNAIVDSMNGERNVSSITTVDVTNRVDFNIDVLARGNFRTSNDQFIVQEIKGDGVVRVDQWALNGDIYGWDAPIDRHITLGNIFITDENGTPLQGNIEVTTQKTFTPIGWYQLNQRLGVNGISSYTLDLVEYNPQVFRGQVATVAQWMNQLNIDDMLFTHSMVLPSFKDEDGGVSSSMMANRYAAESPLFAPYQYSRKNGGLWYKAYGTFENLQMNNGLGKVGNNAYGVLIGADFGLKELQNGWKFMPTAYIGYNGAHQYWAGAGNYQNGGQAGVMGTWYKNNLILGALAYGGIYDSAMSVFGHHEDTFNYFGGAATKASYNIRLHRDWVLQPNLFASYNYFGQQNWQSNFGQMAMMAGDLNGVNIAPGLNLIWERESFSAYLTLQYMYNVNGAVGGKAGNVGLPHMEMERGYIQYGIGFTKKFTDRASGYLQAVLRNAGRTGAGFQLGFNFLLGK